MSLSLSKDKVTGVRVGIGNCVPNSINDVGVKAHIINGVTRLMVRHQIKDNMSCVYL